MKILSVKDPAFAAYGRVLEGYDFSSLLGTLEAQTLRPTDSVTYVPSEAALEADSSYAMLRDEIYGGMPIQIGYCNGTNTKLNCVEYHRDSEINIGAQDFILLLAKQQDITADHKLDTSKVEAFLAPAGTAVEVYATSLHYAPCDATPGAGFRVVVVLPQGTNTDAPTVGSTFTENRLLRARNNWLIAHPDASEAADGAWVGLTGENIDIRRLIAERGI